MKSVGTVLDPPPPAHGYTESQACSEQGAVHAQTGAQPRPAVLLVRRQSSARAQATLALTSRPAESAVREVRKHLLVRIRRRHSAGQETLAAPFVAVVELVQRLPQLAVQPRRLVRCVPRRAFLLLTILHHAKSARPRALSLVARG